MKILLLGADGFIGRHLAFGLRASGNHVVASARRTKRLSEMGFEVLTADLSNPETHSPSFWQERVKGVTHVVNAAGLLTGSETAMKAVHVSAPNSLYATLPSNTPIVLLSAISIDEGKSRFAKVRLEAEASVHKFGGTALRPGLVLADTSYGGSSLGRALSALPWAIPLIDGGAQEVNPIHAEDLARVVQSLLQDPQPGKTLEVGGSETLTQGQMLLEYRRWLGLPKPRKINMPSALARTVGRIGDVFRLGPISATFISMLEAGALAQTNPEISPKPRGFSEFLWARPAGTQDLWQARLYLLKPALRIILAFMWLVSGLIGLFLPSEAFLPLFTDTQQSELFLLALARGGGIIDIAIAAALFRGIAPKLVALIQLAIVGGYTLGISILAPALWLLPLGGLLKNLPILLLLVIHLIFEDER